MDVSVGFIKKAEHQRIDGFELWCWRRLLRVPWTARRSNQSILKEISPGHSLEGLILKLKLQYFGHVMWRVDSFEKTLMLGKIEGRRRRGQQSMRWLDGITNSVDVSLGKTPGVGDGQGGLACCDSWGHKESDTTELNRMTAANDTWTHMKSNRSRVKENWWQGKVLCSTSHSGTQAERGTTILHMWIPRSPCTLASSHHTKGRENMEHYVWAVAMDKPGSGIHHFRHTSLARALGHMAILTCQRNWEMRSSCGQRRFG